MFRPYFTQTESRTSTQNNSTGTRNGTQVETQSFTGTSNTLGSNYVKTGTRNSIGSNDALIYAIVVGNINDVKKMVNSSNVNEIIDTKNKYTALHYAIMQKNSEIVEYLLNCDADPYIKFQNSIGRYSQDPIELAVDVRFRQFIDDILKKKEQELSKKEQELNIAYCRLDKLREKQEKMEGVENLNAILIEENKSLTRQNCDLTEENKKLLKRANELQEDNVALKKQRDEKERAFDNLLKRTKK